jgi:BASS family bile acid:Na+ symporter
MMPIAMLSGIFFYKVFDALAFLTPYLIFVMLLLTYNSISFRNLSISRMHFWLIVIQLLGSLVVYHIIRIFDPMVAQAALICILAPTATAAPVIAAMLNGNISSVASYSLLSNLSVALAAPVIFSYIGTHQNIPFIESFSLIIRQIFPLLLAPFFTALLIRKIYYPVRRKIQAISSLSFYLWVLALAIVTGKTVNFILEQDDPNYLTEILIAICALFICVGQFLAGRRIGSLYQDTVAGGQGLGQKNTILAIWMAQAYLNPIASLGPGSYVLWQNIVNSYQVWRRSRKKDL